MAELVYVTKIVERKWYYPLRGVRLPIFEPQPKGFGEDYLRWQEKYNWRINYHVHKDNLEEAKRFANKWWELGENINPKEEQEIINQLMKIKANDWNEKTDLEKWEHVAVQIPEDWGPIGKNKKKLKEIITEHADGRVLEAMCGFNSYFGESNRITEVIALDFCEKALERYNYPERTRILYDLGRVVNGEKMDFFGDSSFQTIGVFFGIDYLTNPVPVHREFHRILSDGGKLLIVGGTTQGYGDMLKRMFNPEDCSKAVKSAGFSTKVEHLPLKTETELGEYYLVEGRK